MYFVAFFRSLYFRCVCNGNGNGRCFFLRSFVSGRWFCFVNAFLSINFDARFYEFNGQMRARRIEQMTLDKKKFKE